MSYQLLYTTTSYPPATGGAQLHTHEIVRRMAQRHNVSVAAFWDKNRTDFLLGTTLNAPENPGRYTIDGVNVRQLCIPPQARSALKPWVALYYAFRTQAIRRIAPLIESQLEEEFASLGNGLRLIHNSRIGREPISYASQALARRHGCPFFFVPYHHPRWVGWMYRDYLRLYREADGLIALTQSEKETLVTLGARPERIFVTGIGPVVDPCAKAGVFRSRHTIPEGAPIILFLGQKYAYKGVQTLLKAAPAVWARHPEARFVFIGPRTDFSRRLFAEESDHRILEVDSVGLLEKSEALADATCLCLPSTQESFGGVFVEAWSFGKPVVGVEIPSARDIISEGETGLLTPPQPGELAERLLHLLDHPDHASAMGEKGRQLAEARYNWEHLAGLTEDAYRQVLAGGL